MRESKNRCGSFVSIYCNKELFNIQPTLILICQQFDVWSPDNFMSFTCHSSMYLAKLDFFKMFTCEFDLADYLSRQLVRSSYLVNQVCDLFKRLTLIHFLIWYFHWGFPYLNKSNIWSEFVPELYHRCKDLTCELWVI